MPFFPWSKRHLSVFYVMPKFFNQRNIFSMTLIQLTQRFWKSERMRLFKPYYLAIKVFLKIWILGLLYSQFVSLKTVKRLMNHFLLDRNLFDIFHESKNLKYFSPSVSVFYVTFQLWRAVRFSFCVCIVLYIFLFFFKFSLVCRCVCYDENLKEKEKRGAVDLQVIWHG